VIPDARRITLDTIPPFTLRSADVEECVAGGLTPQLAVQRSVAASDRAYAEWLGDDLLCLWGYRRYGPVAMMWMLSTPAVDAHARLFARESRALLGMLLREFRAVRVLVHNGHTQAIRWLEWLGFTPASALNEQFTLMQVGQN